MTELMAASHQWASRPADERFVNLHDMLAKQQAFRANSRERAVATRALRAAPADDNTGIYIETERGRATPSHWAFGQLAGLAAAPAGYMRTLPAEIASDCLNYGLHYKRDVADIGVLLTRGATPDDMGVALNAATGPKYGRIWDADITQGLVNRFGDGTSGDWRVPGIFGKALQAVTRENTTLYAGDRDMFVFLADEENRVEVPDRRDGASGLMARGFFVSNSQVGAGTLAIDTFLFDYVCGNRIVWGAQQHKQVRIRHTPKAPHRWLDEVQPALALMHEAGTTGIVDAITAAKLARIDHVRGGGDINEFLAKRFGAHMPPVLQDTHLEEEGRPVETLWDAVTAATAYARGIRWQNDRVELETKAGKLLDLAVQ